MDMSSKSVTQSSVNLVEVEADDEADISRVCLLTTA